MSPVFKERKAVRAYCVVVKRNTRVLLLKEITVRCWLTVLIRAPPCSLLVDSIDKGLPVRAS